MGKAEYDVHKCNNLAEVQAIIPTLDIASKVDLFLKDNGVEKEVKNYKGIYNNTKGEFCAAVSNGYHLIQHRDYVQGFADALTRLNINHTMVVNQFNNRLIADIKFTDKIEKFEKLNEEFMTGIRLINSYDKSTGIIMMPKLTRLACTNGMILTKHIESFSIKHTAKIAEQIQGLIETSIAGMVNMYVDLKMYVSSSIKDSIEWENACKILSILFKIKKHREGILKNLGLSEIEITNPKTKKVAIQYVFDDKKNIKEKFDRWTIYNAITAYISHSEHVTPHMENWLQKSAEKVLTTPLQELMPKIEVPPIGA